MKELDPTDLIVGKNIKKARLEKGLSQDDVGGHFGVTFQQVQKYETGKNSVNANKLVRLSRFLGRPIGWFFDEDPKDIVKTPEAQKTALRITKLIMSVQNKKQFKALVNLIESLTGERE